MIQDNSLLDQSRHSEQLSMQQLQLAELQKIASTLSTGGMNGQSSNIGGAATSAPSIGKSLPTNMTAVSGDNQNNLAHMAAIGGMAIQSGINGINSAATVGKNALNRSAGYIERMENSPFFAYRNIDWTRTNAEQAEYIQMQSRHRVENAGLKFASSIGNMGMASLGGAAGTAVGGPIGTVVGTVAGSVLGGIGGDQIIKHVGVQQGYEKWLQQNSGKFINMFESNDGLGDGFNEDENKSMAKVLSKMNTKYFMNDDEMFTMLNQVTDAGLMKSSSDMSSFEEKFSGLVESVKSGAKMLNASYEEMVGLYEEWNKMGIKTDSERAQMNSNIKTLSMITGMDEGKTADVLNQLIGGLTQGTTLDVNKATGAAQSDLALASLFREKIGGTDERYADALEVIQNDYKSDDAAVAQALSSIAKSGYNNDAVKSAMGAALTEGPNGLSIDKDKLNQYIEGMNSGQIAMVDVASQAGKNLGNMSMASQEQFSMMNGTQAMGLMVDAVGSQGAYNFLYSSLQSQADRDGRNIEDMMMAMGITQSRNQGVLFSDMTHAGNLYGDAINNDVTRQSGANIIRNSASSEFGVPLSQRLKAGWENTWQTAASWMPSVNSGMDSWKDFITDTDTARRNGYSSSDKTNIAKDEYNNVFKDIEKSSGKLKDEFKIDLKDDLSSKSDVKDFEKEFSNVISMLTSPSKWNNTLFGTEIMTNTDLTQDGIASKKLLKKVNKSKTMTDKEKEAMISNINQASGQTQDMVTGSLDVVTMFGGRDAREKMLDRINVDTATKIKTGAKNFDDFADEKVLSKMSLEQQQQVQKLAVEEATKSIKKQFSGNYNNFGKAIESAGLAEGNKGIQDLLKGGVKESEIKGLVKELMTSAQGGSGKTEIEKIMGTVADDTAKNTSKANKNLDKANKNMEDMAGKIDDFSDTINKAVKTLDRRINTLESTMSKY